ncbi:uncharacterized protein [Macrobrachium rosenbergii]|uniref:uncharacterized protein n=1 Tax=Macrobrachium rosenbergii TaxID=79674 RepID=UPI0034D545F2
MLSKGTIEVIEDRSLGFYSRIFLVEKASGGWRSVIDLSPLNRFFRQTRFTMETVRTVLSAIRENDFMQTVNLMDAYFQVTGPYVVSSVPSLCPQWSGLPIQGSLFWSVDHSTGVHESIHPHFGLGPFARDTSSEQAESFFSGSNQHIQEGSEAVPITAGPTCSTVAGRDWPPVVIGETCSTRETPHLVSPVETEGLLGSILGAPVSSHPHLLGGEGRSHSVVERQEPVHRDTSVLSPPRLASFLRHIEGGLGAHLEELLVAGLWDHHEWHLHINVLEMKAVFLGLQYFQDCLVEHSVALMSDNTTVVAMSASKGVSSPGLFTS